MGEDIRQLLENVKQGKVSVDDALLTLKMEPYVELGYAKVDLHRKLRQGACEVIYGAGKTAIQMQGIVESMILAGQMRVLITRIDSQKAEQLENQLQALFEQNKINHKYYDMAKILVIGDFPQADGIGKIVVATGGTSDIPVAEEAALTAQMYGNEVVRLYDVGVAGLHRLLNHMEDIMDASVVIAIAGMEGALASVVGGLCDCPVIAVPTSVGYGASFHGISALLSMLNSCASGVSVVNIDNGFGAGFLANRINHMKVKNQNKESK